MSREIGGAFSAYNGGLHGTNIDLIQDRRIVQAWRAEEDSWPLDYFSTVVFELIEQDGKTKIKFTQTNIPEEYYDSISQGWYDYYWNPMKEFLEK